MTKQTLEFKLYKKLPKHLKNNEVERAIHTFIKESKSYKTANAVGFFNQTLASIYNALHGAGDFWAAIGKDGKIYGYAIASLLLDIDAELTYWISQGWVSKECRDGEWIRRGWGILEKYARDNNCSHIINVTNRNPRVYIRLLGVGWHEYATILKKDLN